jgi:hypothetical protein
MLCRIMRVCGGFQREAWLALRARLEAPAAEGRSETIMR